jgi:hypothetical protein
LSKSEKLDSSEREETGEIRHKVDKTRGLCPYLCSHFKFRASLVTRRFVCSLVGVIFLTVEVLNHLQNPLEKIWGKETKAVVEVVEKFQN